jgi:hypothetical protein
MNLVFKKSIILTAMTAMLTPQAVFACKSDANCTQFVHKRIEKVVKKNFKAVAKKDKDAAEKAQSEIINILKGQFRGECFINKKALLAAIAMGSILSMSEAPLVAIGAAITGFAMLEILNLKGDPKNLGGETLSEKMTKDPKLKQMIIKATNRIAKTLGTHFYTKHGACWGNATYEKLRLIRRKNKDTNKDRNTLKMVLAAKG